MLRNRNVGSRKREGPAVLETPRAMATLETFGRVSMSVCSWRDSACASLCPVRTRPPVARSREPKRAMIWGSHPSRAGSAPTGPAQKRDTKPTGRSWFQDCPGTGTWGPPRQPGPVRSRRGSGWPPRKGIAWIRIRRVGPSSAGRGEGAGGGILSWSWEWLEADRSQAHPCACPPPRAPGEQGGRPSSMFWLCVTVAPLACCVLCGLAGFPLVPAHSGPPPVRHQWQRSFFRPT